MAEDFPLDEMAHSIGVPRAGLPYMGPLLDAIGRDLTTRGLTFTGKQRDDLAQRLLANYPYLLGRAAPATRAACWSRSERPRF